MKILHTSDWHLGQKFLYNSRAEEHRLALDWLQDTIVKENIDCLIIAGDIFDIGNPPNYARRLYYRFLKGLLTSCCRHIVVIGGNHDSPSMLDAPKELLQALNVHIVGCASDKVEDEIIELYDKNNKLEVVVAAVPFLRDRDVRTSMAGETGLERIDKIKEGISNHYKAIAEAIEAHAKLGIPIIATGHLYAQGAEASDKQDNIYIGNKENIKADDMPSIFDYVALGHIHRAQMIGTDNRIFYSGSIIPLSFSETKDEKAVLMVHFEAKEKTKSVQYIPVPTFRRLKTISGSLEYIQSRLEQLHEKYQNRLTTWVEIIVETDDIIPNLDGLLRDFTKEMNVELLKIRTTRANYSIDAAVEEISLYELKPLEVFIKKCTTNGNPSEEMEELVGTFKELEMWMNEQED